MARKVGWKDPTITGGFRDGADRERQYRGKKGETHVVRVMLDCEEIRQHFVDDVLDPDEKTGEPRGFNMTCSKDWVEDDEEWDGECRGCDREYDSSPKFVTGLIHLATYKGRSKKPTKVDPENSTLWWDFGPDKYRKLSDLALDLERGDPDAKIQKVELVITCEDDEYQKLNINISNGKALTTKAHVVAFKEEGPALVEAAVKAPDLKEQARRLKKRKRSGAKRPSSDSKPDPDEQSSDGGAEEEDLDAILAGL